MKKGFYSKPILTALIFLCISITLHAQNVRRTNGVSNQMPGIKYPPKTEVLTARTSDYVAQAQLVGAKKHNGTTAIPVRSGRIKKTMRVGENPIELWGNMIYSDSWIGMDANSLPYGVYSFKAEPGMAFTPLKTGSNFSATGGSVFFDDKFHTLQYGLMFGVPFCSYYAYDVKTWELAEYKDVEDFSMMSISSAYDPTTGDVYGCFYSEKLDGTMTFGTVNYTTLTREVICDLDKAVCAMAINNRGELYGISEDGMLFSIDKTNGKMTNIGNTGVPVSLYLQSAAFDYKTDKMYWAQISDETGCALYEVNVKTGKAEKISDFPENEEFSCISIPFITPGGSPGKVTEPGIYFYHEETSGKVTFWLPETTESGAPLSGDIDYVVLVNGVEAITGTKAAGEFVSAGPVEAKAGINSFVVYAKNSEGEGKRVAYKGWVSYDEPKPVENIKVTAGEDGRVKITWSPQYNGVHGGWIDYKTQTYDVVRMPGNVTVAENITERKFEETLSTGTMTACSYKVRAHNHTMVGEYGESEKTIVGPAFEVPFFEDFKADDRFLLYNVVDNNEDGYTWTFNPVDQKVYNRFSILYTADDYLVSPPIHLKNDRKYLFSFQVTSDTPGETEKIAACFGKSDESVHDFKEIVPTTTFSNESKTLQAYVSVEEDNNYAFALHAKSPSNQGYLYLDKISVVEDCMFAAPDSVTDLTLTAGEKGDPTVAVRFCVPEKTVDGKQLTSVSKIEIYRKGIEMPIKVFDQPEPGAELTFTDTDLPNGFNTYTIVAYNEFGAGEKYSMNVFVGYDIAAAPTEIVLTDNTDGTATLTWKAPGEKGVNGGYVESEYLTYEIYQLSGNVPVLYAQDVEGTSYTIKDISQTGEQEILAFTVKANSDAGISEPGISTWIATGADYTLPFKEGFPGGNAEHEFWTTEGTGVPGFEIIKTESFDGDNGLAQFLSKSAGESSSIGSGKIALKNAGNPKLTYSYRAVPGKDVQFSVKVRINGGEKKELAGFNFKDLTGDIGWRTEVVDLNELKDSKYIMLYFEAVDNTGSTRVCVDNITILDVLTDNLAIELKTAGNITAGTEITCPVNVKNIGVNDAEEYTINLYANNELVDIKAGESIRFGELKTFDMAYKSKVNDPNELELKVMLEYSKDKDISDNTAVTSVRLIQPDMPGITGLEGTFNEDEQSVNLTWNTPDFEKERATDDFEDLEAFSISDFGKWKVDGNWKYQTMYPEGITWPNAGEPAPFIVFNPSLADFSAYPIFTEFTIPHSGEQFLASISTGAFEGNNAWLISPSLSGKAQTVSFWAKSISGWYGYEKFEIRYSTTGRDIADFDKVAFNEEKLPEEWTEYNVDLPAEARYFAVYVKSENTFMFMIDDITYQPGYGKLLGYNIYRDGKHTGTVTANTTTYTDKAVPNGSHAYNVTAVYTIGESSFSDTYNLYGTSITGIHGDGETYAYGSKASIVVCNAENMEIKVYTTDGKLLSKTYGERKSVIPAIRAQYVVRVGEKTFNVIVE